MSQAALFPQFSSVGCGASAASGDGEEPNTQNHRINEARACPQQGVVDVVLAGKTGEDAQQSNSVRCLFGWAGMSMLISGCQRRGKRSIAILNVPCRGSICQCPRVVGAAAAAAMPLSSCN